MAKLELLSRTEIDARLRESLLSGKLPDCLLYAGDAGARSWMALDDSPEFDVARSLGSLLQTNAVRLVSRMGSPSTVLGVGVGDGRKERMVLAVLTGKCRPGYIALDVSSGLVDRALAAVADIPVESVGVVAMLEDLPRHGLEMDRPALVTILGNSLSNHLPEDIFAMLAGLTRQNDLLLFDAHVRPHAGDIERWRQDTERRYRTAANVAFNTRPLLDLGAAPEDLRFALDLVRVETAFGPTYRTRKSITVLRELRLRVGGSALDLRSGQSLEMGFTFKHSPGQIAEMALKGGFDPVEIVTGGIDGECMIVLARKR